MRRLLNPWVFIVVAVALLVAALSGLPRHRAAASGEAGVVLAPPSLDDPKASAPQPAVAVFAGGCFWGVQAVFQHLNGVLQAVSGYAGDTAATASYAAVSRGDTKHAESVQVTYDPAVVSYGELLQVLFSVAHDPTQHNRQGPDIGPQYRSTVFALTERQREIAQSYIRQLDASQAFASPLATTIEPLVHFYPAEAEHQDYLLRNPSQPYIVFNDLPKLANLSRLFKDRVRTTPVRVQATPG